MAIMGEAERERRHCFLLYKLSEEEKPKKSHAIYAIDYLSKAPFPDNELEMANRSPPHMSARPYVQSIYVAGNNEESFTKNLDSKSPDYHLDFDDNRQQANMGVHGTIAQLPKPRIPVKNDHVPENAIHRFFSHCYAAFILKDGVRALVSISYVVYIIIAIFGCINFREGLEPKNLVTSSHYIASYFEDIKLFWKIGPQLHVAVLSPPDFVDPIQRQLSSLSDKHFLFV